MTNDLIEYRKGVPEKFRRDAVDLYDEAFGLKFSLAIKNTKERKKVLSAGFVLKNSIGAFQNSELVGIAGYHGKSGSLTSGITYKALLDELGFLKGNRATLVFSAYERKVEKQELLMDGIAVRSDIRGLGVGSGLLGEIIRLAEEYKYRYVRLDVIDTNQKAKKLYQRHGFQTISTERFSYLKWLLQFGGVDRMQLKIQYKSESFSAA